MYLEHVSLLYRNNEPISFAHMLTRAFLLFNSSNVLYEGQKLGMGGNEACASNKRAIRPSKDLCNMKKKPWQASRQILNEM